MKTPWHLWLVGVVSLLWNAMGAFDYTATESGNAAYLAQMTPEQRVFFEAFPSWAVASWAVGVWFAVLGSVLLLMRRAGALWAFVLSFLGMALTSLYTFVLAEPSMGALMGPVASIFSIAIAAAAVLLIWYARSMKIAGVLR